MGVSLVSVQLVNSENHLQMILNDNMVTILSVIVGSAGVPLDENIQCYCHCHDRIGSSVPRTVHVGAHGSVYQNKMVTRYIIIIFKSCAQTGPPGRTRSDYFLDIVV